MNTATVNMEVGGIQLEVEQHVYLEASKSIDDHYDWSFPDTKSIIDIDTVRYPSELRSDTLFSS